ncbi:MAG: glycosyl hydrolase family 28-related protein, partial [Myxococcaceae bacterium]
GADRTGAADSAPAIQSAIASASAGGGEVFFPEGLYRCDGVLEVRASRVVLRGEGADRSRLYFTRSSGMTGRAHLSFLGTVSREANLPLTRDGENRAFEVEIAAGHPLAAGDEVALGWLISDAFVAEHGMTGTWTSFAGQWKPFFRREVLGVTTGTVKLDVPLRYPARMRDGASLRREKGYLAEVGVASLGLGNAVDPTAAWSENQVHLLELDGVKDAWIREVSSFAPPGRTEHLQSGGIKVVGSKRVTVAACRMAAAQHRGSGGNGYLFEVSASSEVLIRDSVGTAGRHNFIQNWDFGTTGCVFLRIESEAGRMMNGPTQPGSPGFSEFHHSLATACLVDQPLLRDGFLGLNRYTSSSGAGHTLSQSVFWNASGGGILESHQFGWGYVIGTDDLTVNQSFFGFGEEGTAPRDFLEGLDAGALLEPRSLYDDQLSRRLGR